MSAEELVRLHGPIDVITFAASLSVIGAVGWYLLRMRGRLGGLAGTTAVVAVFVLASAVTRAAQVVVSNVPGTGEVYIVEAVAAAVAVTAAIAVWPMVPRLLSLPTRCELMEVNRRLVAEQEARRTLVEGMQSLNEELERRVAERTREVERERRRFEIALEGTDIAVAEQDRDLRYLWLYNAPANLGGVDVTGRLPEEVLPPATAAAQGAVKRRVLTTGRAERFEVSMTGPKGTTWYEGRVEPLVDGGEVVGVMTVSIDITRHKEHEREVRDMLRELTHRSKNLLAVVQGIARQSGAGRPEIETFVRPFNGRLQALSRAHEILVEENWRGVDLRALVDRERGSAHLAALPFEADLPTRILSPEAGQNFALLLHELFVDARRAAEPTGVRLAWRESEGRFIFEWVRRGAPTRLLDEGFGRLFLDRHMPRSVGGTALLTLSPEATVYRLEAPVSALDATG